MGLYERVELKADQEVQFVGVYVLHWRPEWGEPETGFLEIGDQELRQLLADPENSPSQFGTVPAEQLRRLAEVTRALLGFWRSPVDKSVAWAWEELSDRAQEYWVALREAAQIVLAEVEK